MLAYNPGHKVEVELSRLFLTWKLWLCLNSIHASRWIATRVSQSGLCYLRPSN